MKKVLLIVGSLRKESFNLQLAKLAEEMLKDKAQVSILHYADLPFMNQDIRAGLEPSITALKGLCPDHLDERTRFAGSCLPASGMRCYKYIVYEHIEESC